MASGKQVSFAYGEVSPALRFTSDAAFYSKALAKVKNGFVRKSGGVSNRPGTFYWLTSDYQDNIPTEEGMNVGVRLLSYTSPKGYKYILEIQAIVEGAPGGWDWGANPTYEAPNPIRYITEDGFIYDMQGVAFTFTMANNAPVVLNLKGAVITSLNDSAIISFNDGRILVLSHNDAASTGFRFNVSSDYNMPIPIGTPSAIGGAITSNGSEPKNIPVCYMVMQEQDDGSEVFWQAGCYVGGHPHSTLASQLTVDTQNLAGVKQYNIYRSAGATTGYNGSHFALVGRLAPNSASTSFRDFLVSPDITVQPPLESDLYPPKDHIRRMVYYKERAVGIVKQYQTRLIEGMMIASKIGAPKMFGRPLTPNLLDAFSFTIPQDRLSQITNVLVLSKLVAFTKDVAVYIRGGDGGVLTAEAVNPEVIYHEGCTPDCAPVAVGNQGFFITYDKSKLAMIVFERDDAVTVSDISTLSDHLFEKKDIRHMALVKGFETILYILKTDGTLVSVTIGAEGTVLGYGRHDTDGFIEDIVVQDDVYNHMEPIQLNKYSPTLFLSVLRDGVRRYEKLAVREDANPWSFMFMDSCTSFGSVKPYPSLYNGFRWNITTATNFTAGELLTLTNVNGYGFVASYYLDYRYDFYYYVPIYDEFDKLIGKERKKIRIIPTGILDTNTMTGYCEEDLPEDIQDVESKSLSFDDKYRAETWWSSAQNTVKGLIHLAGKEVSVFADDQVLSSPNNPNLQVDTLVVDEDGKVELPDYYTYGYVGLPFVSEFETLDLEAADARTFTDTGKLINEVGMGIRRTRGGFFGQKDSNMSSMEELKTNEEQNAEITPDGTRSGYVSIKFPGDWEKTGRVLIRQVDPLPMTLLSVYPKGVKGD